MTLHTYIQCVCVCRIVDIQYDSRLGVLIHLFPRCADVWNEDFWTGCLGLSICSWLFIDIQRYSEIFRDSAAICRTKVIASIKNYTMSYPKFISGKRWKRWWTRGVWWFWSIFFAETWGRLPRVGNMMRRRAQQRPLRPRSPTRAQWSHKRPASPKRVATWISSNFGHEYPKWSNIQIWTWSLFICEISKKNGIQSLMKFGLHRDVWWCLWIGLDVSVWDESTKYSIIIIWLSYYIQYFFSMRDVHEASHDSWEKLAQRRGEGDSGKGKGGKGRVARLPPPPPPPHPPQPPTHRIPPKARPVLPGTTGKGRPGRPVPSSSVDETSKRKMSFKDVAAREVKKRRTTVKMVPRCVSNGCWCVWFEPGVLLFFSLVMFDEFLALSCYTVIICYTVFWDFVCLISSCFCSNPAVSSCFPNGILCQTAQSCFLRCIGANHVRSAVGVFLSISVLQTVLQSVSKTGELTKSYGKWP